jgi:hypothetical protein
LDTLTDITKVNFSRESSFKENEYFEQKAVIFGGRDEKKQEILIVKDDIKKQDKAGDLKRVLRNLYRLTFILKILLKIRKIVAFRNH